MAPKPAKRRKPGGKGGKEGNPLAYGSPTSSRAGGQRKGKRPEAASPRKPKNAAPPVPVHEYLRQSRRQWAPDKDSGKWDDTKDEQVERIRRRSEHAVSAADREKWEQLLARQAAQHDDDATVSPRSDPVGDAASAGAPPPLSARRASSGQLSGTALAEAARAAGLSTPKKGELQPLNTEAPAPAPPPALAPAPAPPAANTVQRSSKGIVSPRARKPSQSPFRQKRPSALGEEPPPMKQPRQPTSALPKSPLTQHQYPPPRQPTVLPKSPLTQPQYPPPRPAPKKQPPPKKKARRKEDLALPPIQTTQTTVSASPLGQGGGSPAPSQPSALLGPQSSAYPGGRSPLIESLRERFGDPEEESSEDMSSHKSPNSGRARLLSSPPVSPRACGVYGMLGVVPGVLNRSLPHASGPQKNRAGRKFTGKWRERPRRSYALGMDVQVAEVQRPRVTPLGIPGPPRRVSPRGRNQGPGSPRMAGSSRVARSPRRPAPPGSPRPPARPRQGPPPRGHRGRGDTQGDSSRDHSRSNSRQGTSRQGTSPGRAPSPVAGGGEGRSACTAGSGAAPPGPGEFGGDRQQRRRSSSRPAPHSASGGRARAEGAGGAARASPSGTPQQGRRRQSGPPVGSPSPLQQRPPPPPASASAPGLRREGGDRRNQGNARRQAAPGSSSRAAAPALRPAHLDPLVPVEECPFAEASGDFAAPQQQPPAPQAPAPAPRAAPSSNRRQRDAAAAPAAAAPARAQRQTAPAAASRHTKAAGQGKNAPGGSGPSKGARALPNSASQGSLADGAEQGHGRNRLPPVQQAPGARKRQPGQQPAAEQQQQQQQQQQQPRQQQLQQPGQQPGGQEQHGRAEASSPSTSRLANLQASPSSPRLQQFGAPQVLGQGRGADAMTSPAGTSPGAARPGLAASPSRPRLAASPSQASSQLLPADAADNLHRGLVKLQSSARIFAQFARANKGKKPAEALPPAEKRSAARELVSLISLNPIAVLEQVRVLPPMPGQDLAARGTVEDYHQYREQVLDMLQDGRTPYSNPVNEKDRVEKVERTLEIRETRLFDFLCNVKDEEGNPVFDIDTDAIDPPFLYAQLQEFPDLMCYFVAPRFVAGPPIPPSRHREFQWRPPPKEPKEQKESDGKPPKESDGKPPKPEGKQGQPSGKRLRRGADAPASRDEKRLIPEKPAPFNRDRGEDLSRYDLSKFCMVAPDVPRGLTADFSDSHTEYSKQQTDPPAGPASRLTQSDTVPELPPLQPPPGSRGGTRPVRAEADRTDTKPQGASDDDQLGSP